MFSLLDLRFVLCSRDLRVLRAQRMTATNQGGQKIRHMEVTHT